MSSRTRIAVDAMGGDFAPHLIVEGAIQAAKDFGHEILLVGDLASLRAHVYRLGAQKLNIQMVESQTIIGMDESPAQACRQKPDSSIMVATRLVREGKADAIVSAGNSGATMAAALWHLKRLSGIHRPAITTIMPTLNGYCVVTDAGANVDCKPKHLLQFGVMGAQFVRLIFNRPNPRIGILSIGEEPTKGNELSLAAAELLRTHVDNFIGNVEGRDISKGTADVVVCDGFVGNVVLKFAEGMAESLIALIKEELKSHPIALLGGFLLRKPLRGVHRKIDYAEIGGAPLLGVDGVCIICHGKSNPKAIRNAVKMAAEFVEKGLNHEITRAIEKLSSPTSQGPSSTPEVSLMSPA